MNGLRILARSRRPLATLFALLVPLAFASGAAAQNAELVKDITPPGKAAPPGDLRADDFLVVGAKLFFVVGNDVWVTDGTAAGTELLGGGCQGACAAPQFLAATRGLAFWRVSSNSGLLLVRSDGTRVGTYALPGPQGDLTPVISTDYGPSSAVLGDVLYFVGCLASGYYLCDPLDNRLWRTDGTAAGTRPVRSANDPDIVDELTVWKGRLYYLSFAGGLPSLWTSDGTDAGTQKVKDLKPGARRLTALPDRLVFIAAAGRYDELWASDGTAAGTLPITNFTTPSAFQIDFTPAFHVLGGRAYFAADDGIHGAEIWRSDGTAAGTRRVTEFGYDPFGGTFYFPAGLLGSRLVFVASDGLSSVKLWKTDGTPESTAVVADVRPGQGSDLVLVGRRLVFDGESPAKPGTEVWATDGTAAGTLQLQDICPGACGRVSVPPRPLAGGALFVASDGTGKSDLWTTDGTATGTRRFTHLGTVRLDSPLASLGGRVFFDAKAAHGVALWKSDGTPSGARPVAESWDGPGTAISTMADLGGRLLFTTASYPGTWTAWTSEGTADATLPFFSARCVYCSLSSSASVAGGKLIFLADYAIWRTDATAAGTLLLHDGYFGLSGSAPLGDQVFAALGNIEIGTEIWQSDGTPAGTRKVFDLPSDLRFGHIATAAGKVFLDGLSTDGRSGGVWASDGSAAGWTKISDLRLEDPFYTTLGSRAFFFHVNANEPSDELWVTDGSPSGTVRAAALPVEDYRARTAGAAAYGGALLVFVRGVNSNALWRSDGTAAGTVKLHDFSQLDETFLFTAAGGLLYFDAYDLDHGDELWKTDGTAAGTAMVRDVLPGPRSSRPAHLTAFGGKLYFTVDDGVHGTELWQSDGTEAGTHLAQDIAPGLPGSSPDQLTVAGDHLFFTADDGLHGRELWALPLPGSTAGCEPSPAHLCLQGGRFRVEADWRDFQGNTGTGTAVALTPDTGYFWFFNPANVEVVTKVLDGRGVNQAFWVFYGALSSVEYALTVTDTQTGLSRRYENPAGELASVGDTRGFGPLGAFDTERDIQKEAERARTARSLTLVSARTDPRAATAPCVPAPGRLCLSDGRFAVTAHWKDFQGHTGDGTAVPLTGDTGYFWFFSPTNVEVVAKVIDGRAVNDKFWLFYGALSSVEYTLTVTDAQTGAVKMYKNARGNLASVADTGAF